MNYLTVKETARRWGVSVRTVNMHLNAGRVPGAVRKEHGWLVPQMPKNPWIAAAGRQRSPMRPCGERKASCLYFP